MQTKLQCAIERFNILETPTRELNLYFRSHKTAHKAALLANHLFRAASMAALMTVLPIPSLISHAACFGGSLFYRLTVETNCAYKFALPAWAGSIALLIASGATTKTALANAICFIPLTAWAAYVLLTVSYDVDHR